MLSKLRYLVGAWLHNVRVSPINPIFSIVLMFSAVRDSWSCFVWRSELPLITHGGDVLVKDVLSRNASGFFVNLTFGGFGYNDSIYSFIQWHLTVLVELECRPPITLWNLLYRARVGCFNQFFQIVVCSRTSTLAHTFHMCEVSLRMQWFEESLLFWPTKLFW